LIFLKALNYSTLIFTTLGVCRVTQRLTILCRCQLHPSETATFYDGGRTDRRHSPIGCAFLSCCSAKAVAGRRGISGEGTASFVS
jgi:hypothetical protein